MVANMTSARVGGGGISIPVIADLEPLTASLSKGKALLAQWERDSKVKQKVDWDLGEQAAIRATKAVVTKIQTELGKSQVAVRLEALGLKEIAQQLGLIKTQAQAIRPIDRTPEQQRSRDTLAAALKERRAFLNSPTDALPQPVTTLDMIAEAGKARPSRPNQSGRFNTWADAGGAMFVAREVERAVSTTMQSAVGFGNAMIMSGSATKSAALTGQMGMMDAVNSIPIIGSVTKLFDEAAGFTRALRVRVEADRDTRAATVEAARLTHNRVRSIEAEGEERLIAMRSKYAEQGIEIIDENGQISASTNGAATARARDEALNAYVLTRNNIKSTNDRALLESEADNYVRAAKIRAERMRANRENFSASLEEFDAQAKAELFLADPAKRGQIHDLQVATRARMVKDEQRRRDFARFDTDTAVGAAQMRVANRGATLSDETTFLELRAIQSSIDQASDEGGDKARARLAGLARARAVRTGLNPYGGGNGAVEVNAATSYIGDFYGYDPETKAIRRARTMADQAIVALANGDRRALDMSRTEPWQVKGPGGGMQFDDGIANEILKTLIRIADQWGRPATVQP